MITNVPIFSIEVPTEPQPNGLYGTPVQCVGIDKVVERTEEAERVFTAILVTVAAAHPNETFKVCFSHENGFMLDFSGSSAIYIEISDYELRGNNLVYVKRK
jgi:hypothetical protein